MPAKPLIPRAERSIINSKQPQRKEKKRKEKKKPSPLI